MNAVKYGGLYNKGVALLVVLVMGIAVLAAQPVRAQAAQAANARQIVRAFESGDAHALLAEAVDRLEISLFGTNTSYSRGQALYVLEDFFRNYPPRRFTLQGNRAAGGNRFAMGSYWYEGSDRPLHVYLRMRAERGNWVLHELRIGGQ